MKEVIVFPSPFPSPRHEPGDAAANAGDGDGREGVCALARDQGLHGGGREKEGGLCSPTHQRLLLLPPTPNFSPGEDACWAALRLEHPRQSGLHGPGD